MTLLVLSLTLGFLFVAWRLLVAQERITKLEWWVHSLETRKADKDDVSEADWWKHCNEDEAKAGEDW